VTGSRALAAQHRMDNRRCGDALTAPTIQGTYGGLGLQPLLICPCVWARVLAQWRCHAHHLIGDPIRFLLIPVIGLVDR